VDNALLLNPELFYTALVNGKHACAVRIREGRLLTFGRERQYYG
jgi:hypothetical protein